MRFATFNIHHGVPPGRTEVDQPWLCAAVDELAADVVGLQEVDRATARTGGLDQPAMLARATGMAAHFGRAIRLGGGGYGNVVLVRGEVVEVSNLHLPSHNEDRMAILARVAPTGSGTGVDDRPWWVAVTHLENRRRGGPDDGPAQLEAVLEGLDRLAGSERAVLLGDLNMGPDRVEPALAARGYRPAIGPPTFPSHRPRERIDWIAVRGAGVDAVWVPDVRVSDHRPLVADLVADGVPGAEVGSVHMDGPPSRP